MNEWTRFALDVLGSGIGCVLGWLVADAIGTAVTRNTERRSAVRQMSKLCDHLNEFFWEREPSGNPQVEHASGIFRKRRREREISTLSAPGEEGQVARFCFRKTPWSDPGQAFPDQSVTPSQESLFSGHVLIRKGGYWQRALDRTPDIVTAIGSPQPGDLVDRAYESVEPMPRDE